MKTHSLRVWAEKEQLPQQEQLVWKLAECALAPAPIDQTAADMVINRLIDNAAAALAGLERAPVQCARDQALNYPRRPGGLIFGCSNEHTFSAEWCAWANGTAVRELDFHDTFLAEDYAHPADNIPPILAAAQQTGQPGSCLLRGILSAYEIHIALVKSICLHKHKIDHIAHLCPAQAAGIGALLNMDPVCLYHALNQAVHVSVSTRQSRKGAISSWKAFAPAHAGKLAVEAVDRALRGESSPSPIYEGEDSVLARLLDGPSGQYKICLPELKEPKRAILESYTKAHSAEYQAQAFIDLAFELHPQVPNLEQVKEIIIYTSHHTHFVIGTGAGDPQKQDPHASRQTLDHSLSYIFAVALEDGFWHHVKSYTNTRAKQAAALGLWQKIKTCEDKKWTKLYHHPQPELRCFGGRAEVVLKDGSCITAEKHRANAHPGGDKPFKREDYIQKFMELSRHAPVSEKEKARFLSLVRRLPELSAQEVRQLNVQAKAPLAKKSAGLLDWPASPGL